MLFSCDVSFSVLGRWTSNSSFLIMFVGHEIHHTWKTSPQNNGRIGDFAKYLDVAKYLVPLAIMCISGCWLQPPANNVTHSRLASQYSRGNIGTHQI